MTTTTSLSELLTLDDFECAARERLEESVWAYIAGGAGSNQTVDGNLAAFEEVWLQPRALASGCSSVDTATTLVSRTATMPVVLAPTSPQRLLHPHAELATAQAAERFGVPQIVSTDSHHTFAEICAAAPNRSWFQLYAYRSMADTVATAAMAEDTGASALVITIDAAHSARRISAQRAGFCAPPDLEFGNLRLLGIMDGEIPPSGRLDRIPITWDDIAAVRSSTRLPVMVKGILRASDARACIDHGVDGVIVSNHGGRQLDSVVPTLVALESIAEEVSGRCALLVDGGVRSGLDIVKALALGADAVCIGRPYLWGLVLAGAQGVLAVLELLRSELENSLLQLGITKTADITRDLVADLRWTPVSERTRTSGR